MSIGARIKPARKAGGKEHSYIQLIEETMRNTGLSLVHVLEPHHRKNNPEEMPSDGIFQGFQKHIQGKDP